MNTLLLEKFVPFSAINMKEKDYFGRTGVEAFGEMLKSNLKKLGICIKDEENPILPEKDGFGDYVCFVITEGDTLPKKLDIIIDSEGKIKFEISGGSLGSGKWTSIRTSRFLTIDKFNQEFEGIVKDLE